MNEQLPILHELCLRIAKRDFKERLQILAEFFLNCKYGAWANGTGLESLDDFNYDLATLDCVTYVEVVLALLKTAPQTSYSNFIADFENLLRHIHYVNGKPSFLASNHFFCIDWIANNKYLVEDITHSLSKDVKTAETMIDKLTWFKRHKVNQGKELEFSELIQKQLIAQQSIVPYITTEEILDTYPQMVQKFPEYCMVSLVRPNWDLTDKIGTHLNISHVAFVLKDLPAQELKFYHATIEQNKVVQETLQSYMQRHVASPTIRGINVCAISPGFHHAR